MKIISIANRKGGVGKTVISANLAYELSKMGYLVLMVDLDSPNGQWGRSYFAIKVDRTGTSPATLSTVLKTDA